MCPFGWRKEKKKKEKKWSIDGIARGLKIVNRYSTRCPWHFNNQFFNACSAACSDRATVDKSHLNDRDLIKGAGKPFDVWRTRVTISNRPPTTDWIQIQRSKLNLHHPVPPDCTPFNRYFFHRLVTTASLPPFFPPSILEKKIIRSVSRSRKTSPPPPSSTPKTSHTACCFGCCNAREIFFNKKVYPAAREAVPILCRVWRGDPSRLRIFVFDERSFRICPMKLNLPVLPAWVANFLFAAVRFASVIYRAGCSSGFERARSARWKSN